MLNTKPSRLYKKSSFRTKYFIRIFLFLRDGSSSLVRGLKGHTNKPWTIFFSCRISQDSENPPSPTCLYSNPPYSWVRTASGFFSMLAQFARKKRIKITTDEHRWAPIEVIVKIFSRFINLSFPKFSFGNLDNLRSPTKELGDDIRNVLNICIFIFFYSTVL